MKPPRRRPAGWIAERWRCRAAQVTRAEDLRAAIAVPAPQLPPPSCPQCGGRVGWSLTCHTYGSGGRFYACMPCDSAVEYSCVEWLDDESRSPCRWEYTHGLNLANPRSAANEAARPGWLPDGQRTDRPMAGVPSLRDA